MDKSNPNKEFTYYSENILKYGGTNIQEQPEESVVDMQTAVAYPMLSWQVKTEKYAPPLERYCVPKYEKILEPAQKWVKFPGRMSIAFPIKTIQPITRKASDFADQMPVEVEIERLRKIYAKLNLEDLLQNAGIEPWMLTPVNVLDKLLVKSKDKTPIFQRKGLFPLDWFDDRGYDSMSPDDWLKLGLLNGVRHPIPAKAFLPKRKNLNISGTSLEQPPASCLDFEDVVIEDDVDYETLRNELYSWRYVAVKDYDKGSEKWIVTDLDTIWTYKVPRIFLMFIAENPHDFVKRIKKALTNRAEAENLLKFELVIDCLLTSGVPQLTTKVLNKIRQIGTANLKFIVNEDYMVDLKAQINLNYQRVLVKYEFQNFLSKHPDEFSSITIPKEIKPVKKRSVKVMDSDVFNSLRQFLKKIHILYVAEAVTAMFKVVTECKIVENMSLFTFSLSKSTTLLDFVSTQQYNVNTVIKFIKGFWVENIAGQICMCLRSVGKGWLDISIRDWWVYQVSKIFRFLQQIKYRMQDTVQVFLENSISQYTKYLVGPCEGIGNVQSDFVWDNDLKTSPFKQTGPTIFHMLLTLSQEGAYYSTKPEEFAPILVKILEDALILTVGIPLIDANVMTHLEFAKNLYVDTIELIEDIIVENRNLIREAYERAIIPLKAYALKYESYMELYFTNVNDYITEFSQANKSSLEVKEEILHQRKLKENLKTTLPASMPIGPFFINVDPLKQLLIDKRAEIIRRLLEYFCDRMLSTTENLIEQFDEIMQRLSEKPQNIEHVMDVKEYMLTIPSLLEGLEDKLRLTILEYDVLDYFFYNLTNEHFGLKWEAIGWPHKIIVQIAATKEQHKHDIEDFKKVQMDEIQSLHDRTETLNDEIAAYRQQSDPTKAQELSVNVRNTWKIIQELVKLGELLQSRQQIFELPEISLEHLEALTESFEPFKDLWTTCADFIKLEDLTFGNPLSNIDVEEIKKTVGHFKKTLNNSVQIFSEMLDVQQVARTYLDKINDFQPSLEAIEFLKNPNWLTLHWQELARRADIDLKYTVAINFAYCIRKGVLDHVDLMKEISERATFEADEIKRALEEEERLKREASFMLLQKRKQRKCRTDI